MTPDPIVMNIELTPPPGVSLAHEALQSFVGELTTIPGVERANIFAGTNIVDVWLDGKDALSHLEVGLGSLTFTIVGPPDKRVAVGVRLHDMDMEPTP